MEMTESPNTLLTPALRAFLGEIIDYAGLFPPAGLPLDEAVHNYARYRHDPEAWMLARFVMPVGRLDELRPFAKLFREPEPFVFSVLGTGGRTPEAFLDAFDRDLEAIDRFHEDHHDRVRADVMEVRLPPSLLHAESAPLRDFFAAGHRRLVMAGTAQLDLFYEVPYDVDDAVIRTVLVAMADHNSTQAVPARSEVGFKMRCGGLEPDAFPPVEHVARVIAGCRNAGVRFKATAGLHHPVRHYSDEVDAYMHGFFNVFGAAVLAVEHELAEDGLQAILLEEDPEAFQFTKEEFSWRDLTAPLGTLYYVRERLAVSFGSCSFDEPRDDLKALEFI